MNNDKKEIREEMLILSIELDGRIKRTERLFRNNRRSGCYDARRK